MGAQAHAHLPGALGHPDEVALQCIEIQHQAGRLHIGRVHPGQGRDVVANRQSGEMGFSVHGVAFLSPLRGDSSQSVLRGV